MQSEEYVQRHERLAETAARNRTFNLPDVLIDRLDDLLAAMEAEGYLANRADLVGALIARSPQDPSELHELTQHYRQMTVEDVVVGEAEGESIPLRKTTKGPRPRK